MSEERYYSAEYGYDDAISVVGDGDCKLASFSRPKNSSEEEWFAYGSDEDEDAIANLAVYMRDELRACIVEMDRVKAINKELLEALEDCCVIAKPKNPACCCPVYRRGQEGGCVENEYGECHIWRAIQKERGQL